MKLLNLLVFACGILLFVGCSDDDQPASTNNQDNGFFPLSIGNYWIYTDPINNEFTSTEICYKDTIVDNTKYHLIKVSDDHSDHSKRNEYIYSAHTQGGDYYWDMYPEITNSERIFKYPCSLNEEFTSINDMLCKVVDISDNITVPAGTFNCIKYQIVHTDYEMIDSISYWVCPGIGIVREYRRSIDNMVPLDTKSCKELSSYYVQNK